MIECKRIDYVLVFNMMDIIMWIVVSLLCKIWFLKLVVSLRC